MDWFLYDNGLRHQRVKISLSMKLNAVLPLSKLSPDCLNASCYNSVDLPFCFPQHCSFLLLLHSNCKLFCDLLLGEVVP